MKIKRLKLVAIDVNVKKITQNEMGESEIMEFSDSTNKKYKNDRGMNSL